MKNLIGQQIGQYQIEALLGEGGMGVVYRAHDLKHNRMVAIKIMLSNLVNKHQFKSRFLQEADAITNFSSPAIVTIYDTGEYEEAPYIVMEYIEGGSLINYLRQLEWSGQKLSIETILTVAAQIAEGLSYAHQRGLIHRDIKPGNILLKMRKSEYVPRQAVITDFGLAIQLKNGSEMDTAPFMGSLAYMSPEQCENKPLDGRSDIYSLGILLYQLSTGQLPHQISAPADIVKHLNESPLPPRLLNPDMPEILETIILKAMAKKPSDRYQSSAELAHALRQAQSNPELLATAVTAKDSSVVTQWLDNKWIADVNVEGRVDIHQTWTSLGDHRLFIVHQYEESKVVGLEKDEILIGRSPNCDVILEDQSVSSRHLRMVRTPQGWNVNDLGSTNHSYIGERILEYGQTYDWPSSEQVRVGPYFIRWQPFDAKRDKLGAAAVVAGAALAGAAIAQPNKGEPPISNGTAKEAPATPPPSTPSPTPSAKQASDTGSNAKPVAVAATAVAAAAAGAAAVNAVQNMAAEFSDGDILGIAINPPVLELNPLAQGLLEISITNRDVTVKDVILRLDLNGYPPPWINLSDYQIKLLPSETIELSALVDLSQAPDILAGENEIKLVATTDKGEIEVNHATVTINPVEDFNLDLHPSNLQEKVFCRLTIHDQSNFSNEYTVMGLDDSDALAFDFSEPHNATLLRYDDQSQEIRLAPRQEAWVNFKIRPKKRPLFGNNQILPFKVRVNTPETEWQALSGQVEIAPRITRRLLLFLLLLLLLFGGAGYLMFYQYQTAQAERYAELELQLNAAEERADAARSQLDDIEAQIEEARASGASEEEIAQLEAARAAAAAELDAAAAIADTLSDEVTDLDPTAAAESAAATAEAEAAEATAIAASWTPTPVPNNPPTGIEFSAGTVTENVEIGSTVGEFTAEDPDVARAGGNIVAEFNRSRLSRTMRQADDFTFSLVSGSGSTNNDMFDINGNELVTVADIDYEKISSLSFRVQVEDEAGDTFAKSFTLTVVDTDDIPKLSITDVTVSEGDRVAEITVAVSGDNYDTATVDYSVADGTAVAGTDYTTASGTLTWDKGETDEQIISVPILNNDIDEPDRTFVVTLSNAVNAIIDSGSATVTILDDDDAPTLAVTDLTVSEDVTGGKATISVQLTGASKQTVSVDYITTDSTAVAGTTDDYIATSGTLTWAPEDTAAKTFEVTINEDDIDEPDETFLVTISNAVNSSISDSEATITISDNNEAPRITIGDVTVEEELTQISVPVTMTGKSSQESWVEYSTSSGGSANAATSEIPDPDFNTVTDRLTWAAETEGVQYITIQINEDDIDEPDPENFVVTLFSNSSSTVVQDTTGNVYISDDDDPPVVSLGEPTTPGYSENDTANHQLPISIAGRSSQQITVYYSTASTGSAIADQDYTAVQNHTVIWEPLESAVTKFISLNIIDDNLYEPDPETFRINLGSNPINAQIDNTADSRIITILSDDAQPVISVSAENSSVAESDNGAPGEIVLNVSLNRPSTQEITVAYSTVADNTGSHPAIVDTDFISRTNTLTWAAQPNGGEPAVKQITLVMIDDEIYEYNETFLFRLSNPTNATFSGGSTSPINTTLTINNDEPEPIMAITSSDPMTVTETTGSTVQASLTITLSRQTSVPITGEWETQSTGSGPQNARIQVGNDLEYQEGEILWDEPSDALQQTITVNVNDDDIDELAETFSVALQSGGVGIVEAGSESTIVYIQDNDSEPDLEIGSITVPEGAFGETTPFNIPITMTGRSYQPISVTYTISSRWNFFCANATLDTDYVDTGTTVLTWPAEQAGPQYIPLEISGDDWDEGYCEYVYIYLEDESPAGAVNYPEGYWNGQYSYIEDDDEPPLISIQDVTVDETVGTAVISVTMQYASATPITATYGIDNYGSIEPADYSFTAGELTWPAGDAGPGIMTFTVGINDDTIDEQPSEYLSFGIIDVSPTAEISATAGTMDLTILDDDYRPVITAAQSLTVTESTTPAGDIGSPVGATDANGDSLQNWIIVSVTPNSGDSFFTIDNSTGQFVLTAAGETGIDYETETNYVVSLTVTDGTNTSNPENFTIYIENIDDEPPSITVNNPLVITEGDTDVTITTASHLDAVDLDIGANDNLLSFTVDSGPSEGTLNLTTFTRAQLASNAVTYSHTDDNTDGTDTFDFTVTDPFGHSVSGTFTISITPINDPPELDLNGPGGGIDYNGATYQEGNAAVYIVNNSALTLTDSDSPIIGSATITLTNLIDTGNETLSAQDTGNIVSNWTTDPSGYGVLHLNGDDSPLAYQTVLRTVRYINNSDNPDSTTRIINFVVDDEDGGNSISAVATSYVGVVPVNDPPYLDLDGNNNNSSIDYTAVYTEDLAAQLIVDQNLILYDPDNDYLSGATVTINNRLNGASEILTATATTNVIPTYSNGVLTLTPLDGTSALESEFQQVLRSVSYQNLSDAPNTTTRQIEFSVSDTAPLSNNPNPISYVSIVPVNDAPILLNSVTLTVTNIISTVTNTNGLLVSQILATTNRVPATGAVITDPDAGSVEGIAVIDGPNNNTSWQYSINGGSSWTTMCFNGGCGPIDGNNVLLLAATDRIRCIGTPAGSLTFRAWDQTAHAHGEFIDPPNTVDPTGPFSINNGTINVQ